MLIKTQVIILLKTAKYILQARSKLRSILGPTHSHITVYLIYYKVSGPITLRIFEIIQIYFILYIFILGSIYTKILNTYHIFWKMVKL